MISGFEKKELKKLVDERGFLIEIMRNDWKIFDTNIIQSNISLSKPGVIRAWHKHEREQIDYIVVLDGEIKLCVFDEKTRELDEVVCSSENPELVRIPGSYWHGYKVIGAKPALVVYFFNKLYDYKNPDELRKPFDDLSIIPKIINGSESDDRVEKPWSW